MMKIVRNFGFFTFEGDFFMPAELNVSPGCPGSDHISHVNKMFPTGFSFFAACLSRSIPLGILYSLYYSFSYG